MLVQSTKEDGKAGYVPANYVEPHNEEEAQATPQVVVPPSVRNCVHHLLF